MKSMRGRLMAILAFILLFFQTISVIWLWHESREQIDFLVSQALSVGASHNHNALIEKEIREAIASLLIPSLVVVACTLFFSFWAISWVTRPLNQLSSSLSHRSASNLAPLPVFSGMQEVGAITSALNKLFVRLDNSLQQERLFTADAAHELRTPLAGVKLHLELMEKSGVPQARMLLDRIDRLMHTIEQLLMLARAGQEIARGHGKMLNWSEDILSPLRMEMEEMARQRQQTLCWPAPRHFQVQGNAILLRLMLRNLLENAARYSPEQTRITITLVSQQGGTLLTVRDQGPGIAEAFHQQITEPFRRMDSSYGGFGLGLNIVLRIIQLHHGKLTLENGPGGEGLLAHCWLPTQIESQ